MSGAAPFSLQPLRALLAPTPWSWGVRAATRHAAGWFLLDVVAAARLDASRRRQTLGRGGEGASRTEPSLPALFLMCPDPDRPPRPKKAAALRPRIGRDTLCEAALLLNLLLLAVPWGVRSAVVVCPRREREWRASDQGGPAPPQPPTRVSSHHNNQHVLIDRLTSPPCSTTSPTRQNPNTSHAPQEVPQEGRQGQEGPLRVPGQSLTHSLVVCLWLALASLTHWCGLPALVRLGLPRCTRVSH